MHAKISFCVILLFLFSQNNFLFGQNTTYCGTGVRELMEGLTTVPKVTRSLSGQRQGWIYFTYPMRHSNPKSRVARWVKHWTSITRHAEYVDWTWAAAQLLLLLLLLFLILINLPIFQGDHSRLGFTLYFYLASCRQHGEVWYGILGFNVPLDTV